MNTVFLNKQFNDNRFILCYRTLEDKDGILPMNRFDTVSNRFWYDPVRFASFMNANLYLAIENQLVEDLTMPY